MFVETFTAEIARLKGGELPEKVNPFEETKFEGAQPKKTVPEATGDEETKQASGA